MATSIDYFRSNIIEAIDNLKNIKHAKTSKEKIFNFMKKKHEDLNRSFLDKHLDSLVDDKTLKKKKKGDSESYSIAKSGDIISDNIYEFRELTTPVKENHQQNHLGNQEENQNQYQQQHQEHHQQLYEQIELNELPDSFNVTKSDITNIDHTRTFSPSLSEINQKSDIFNKSPDPRDEKIKELVAEISALKDFVIEQLYLIKKALPSINYENERIPNADLLENLKEEIRYLRNDNLNKTEIIKELSGKHFFPSTSSKSISNENNKQIANQQKVDFNCFALPRTTSNEIKEQHDVKKKTNDKIASEYMKNQQNITNNRKSKTTRKRTLIIGDSIVKDIEGWRVQKRMKSNVSVTSITGAKIAGMKCHVKGCIKDIAPDTIFIHHGTNELSSERPSEDIATDIANHAESLKSKINRVFVSGLVIRTDQFNKKREEVNEILKKKCYEKELNYIDNDNITSKMLTSKGIHLNENGTVRLVNNFCSHANK